MGITRLAGLVVVLLGACSSTKDKNETVTISGRLFQAGPATPIANAEVALPDGTRTKSDRQGAFTAQSKSGKSVTVEREGYAPVSKPAPQGGGYLELYAKPTDAKENIQPGKGGDVSSSQGGKVNVPANAFTSKEGKDPKESVVELAVPDPRKSTDLPSLPGDFDARKGGKAGKVSAESPMYLSAKDGGKSLEVADDKSLEASFPVRRAGGGAGTLFHFDEDKQEWEERGEASISKNKAAGESYDVALDELGWWTVGEFYDRLTCVRACVIDSDEKRASFARAVATGIDHFTQVTAYAGEDGCFALAVRADAQVSLSVQTQAGFVPARVVKTSDSEIDVSDDPGDCQDLGKLVLQEQKVRDCPQGLEKCADACVDVLNDFDNCGKCGEECGGTEGRELSCIDGECGCPRGFTTCIGGEDLAHCTLRDSDIENCGGCGIACTENEQCVEGVCKSDGEAMPDGGMDAGIDSGEPSASCFPAGVNTPACEACANTCCDTCTGECPALLACAYDKCSDPRDCAFAQVCPNEATSEAILGFQAFVACTSNTCGSLCDNTKPDGGPGARTCEVVTLGVQQCSQTDVCLGASYRVQCVEGATTTTYDWRVTGPSDSLCAVSCLVNNVATGSTCSYAQNVCGDPDVTTVACDPKCAFPADVATPTFGPPAPHQVPIDAGVDDDVTPGNDVAGTVSCGGGGASAEVACPGPQACCMQDQATAMCKASTTACSVSQQAVCDGPEDCAGQKCCLLDQDTTAQTVCAATCPLPDGGVTPYTVCHQASDCPVMHICVQDSLRPFWGVCMMAPIQ